MLFGYRFNVPGWHASVPLPGTAQSPPAPCLHRDRGEYRPSQRPTTVRRNHPETARARDAKVRVVDQDIGPDSDGASDMYVMEVFGVSLLIRVLKGEPHEPENPDSLFVHIDNGDREPCTLAVEVCQAGETDYKI